MVPDNLIQTFHLEAPNLRGRILRLGPVLDGILKRHAYPKPLTRLAGEAAGMGLLLSSMLKYDGIFTLQIQGDGDVSMVVADVSSHGDVRVCVHCRKGSVIPENANPMDLLGQGYLAFTVDQGEDMERYQGIVELTGRNIQESVRHYFSQSEQIATGMRFAMGQDAEGQWRAGGILLQRLPEQAHSTGEALENDWQRVMILLQSCTDEELLDPDLSQNDLLFRLFHEEGIRVYGPLPVRDVCRCSPERAENILRMIAPEERKDMTVEGKLVVTCEFCNRVYTFEAGMFDE